MQFQDELFDSKREFFNLTGGRLILIRNFLKSQVAEELFHQFNAKTTWEQNQLFIANRYVDIPRLNAWYADSAQSYTYSGIQLQPLPEYAELKRLRHRLINETGLQLNSCLLNCYRDGQDSVAWHCDDEPELGRNPTIVSISLGAERKFMIRSLNDHNEKLCLLLPHNSLLIMEGEIQHRYEHQVPKEANVSQRRINLTFRQIF